MNTPENSQRTTAEKPPEWATAALVLASGRIFWGRGIGAAAEAVGEVCFNTSLTGYQEILTDPSYAGQIITFTFPHIGNVGANDEDIETLNPAARGLVLRADITQPSNHRALEHLDAWLVKHNLPGICGIDTRALTRLIRDGGAPTGVVCHRPEGDFDIPAMRSTCAGWPGLEGMDLAAEVTCRQNYTWDETEWRLGVGYGQLEAPTYHVVAMDFGIKRNILRCLASSGCKVTVVPASASAADILALNPDGIFLSNGPGDPAATGRSGSGQIRQTHIRHLSGPPNSGPGPRRRDRENAPRPSRRQSTGQGPGHGQGGDHLAEPWFRGPARQPARRRGGNPYLAVRRLPGRNPGRGPTRILGAISPGSLTRPPGQPLPVPTLYRPDGSLNLGDTVQGG